MEALHGEMHASPSRRRRPRAAGVLPDAVDVLYLTGGSTGFAPLVARIGAVLPGVRTIHGDRHASVAQGLGVHAQRLHAAGQDNTRPWISSCCCSTLVLHVDALPGQPS